MLNTALEFAPGTTEECQKLIAKLFEPGQILGAYKMARRQFGTGDLVLSVSEQDPSGFQAEPRTSYIRRIKDAQGSKSTPLLMRGLVDRSAHGVVKLPFESDAMWLVIARGLQTVPVMCVLFAVQSETASQGADFSSNLGAN